MTVFTPSPFHVAVTARTEGSGYFPRPCRHDDVSRNGMLFQLLTLKFDQATVIYMKTVVRVEEDLV